MAENKRTFWYCGGMAASGHVVGELGSVDLQKEVTVTALLLYAQSLDAPPEQLPCLRGRIVGTVLDIQCTCCDNKINWYIGQAAMARMLGCDPKDV